MTASGGIHRSLFVLFGGAGLALIAGLAVIGHSLGLHPWLTPKAVAADTLIAQAWARAQAGEPAPKPWPWADTWPVARLSAPAYGTDAIVLHEAGGEAMAFGPAWLAQTPQPGERGVSVIAAHRDTHFAFLKDLEPGDIVDVERADGGAAPFEITHTEIVRHDASGIVPEDGGPARLALVTCWPFGTTEPGPLRYVVWGRLMSPSVG